MSSSSSPVCRRTGFVAYAPDLYRGETAETVADAERLGAALDAEHVRTKADIARAVAHLGSSAQAAADPAWQRTLAFLRRPTAG